MEIVATQKFLRMSPRKLRVVAGMVREMTPMRAIEVLPYTGRRAALPLQKVIKTAIANARVKGVTEDQLVFASIQINQGPQMKRFRAGSRGRAKPYTRDMSHIRVVLTEMKADKQNVKPVVVETEEVAAPVEKKARIQLPKIRKAKKVEETK
jgi:large subunit ribosomal protein L22